MSLADLLNQATPGPWQSNGKAVNLVSIAVGRDEVRAGKRIATVTPFAGVGIRDGAA